MPIRREFRRYYRGEWQKYRLLLISAAENTCAHCLNILPSSKLAAAHIAHDPRTSDVRILCFSCHRRHDARHSRAVARRTLARRYGQAWLSPELEWAPVPSWMVPRRLVLVPRPEQGRLWAA
jgi:hypothetical protein